MKIKYIENNTINELINELDILNEAFVVDTPFTILNIDKISCSNNATNLSTTTSNEIEGINLKSKKILMKWKSLIKTIMQY